MTAIAPAPEAPAPDSRVVFSNVSWETYEALTQDRGAGGPRLAYDRGVLEAMSSSIQHEKWKSLIGALVRAYSEELGIDLQGSGCTTFRSQLRKRGLEPDDSFYVAHEASIRQVESLDLETHPPPDLAVEIELTRSSLDQLNMYAALKVPEVWSRDAAGVVARCLEPSGSYRIVEKSAALPGLAIAELNRFLAMAGTRSETQIVRELRVWVCGQVKPC